MPLKKGKSKKAISKNITELMKKPSKARSKGVSTLAKRLGATKKEAQKGKRGLDDFWKNLSGVPKKARKRRKDDVSRMSTPTQSLFAFD